MEELKIWAFGLCGAAICAGLMELLWPKAGLSKMMKRVVAVFLLGCIFAPTDWETNWVSELLAPEQGELAALERQTARLSQDWTDRQREMVTGTLEGQAAAFLQTEGLTAEKITLINHVAGDGRIHISECEIVLTLPPEDVQALARRLEQQLGVPVRIREN